MFQQGKRLTRIMDKIKDITSGNIKPLQVLDVVKIKDGRIVRIYDIGYTVNHAAVCKGLTVDGMQVEFFPFNAKRVSVKEELEYSSEENDLLFQQHWMNR